MKEELMLGFAKGISTSTHRLHIPEPASQALRY